MATGCEKQIEIFCLEAKHCPKGKLDPLVFKAACRAIRNSRNRGETPVYRGILLLYLAFTAVREEAGELAIYMIREELEKSRHAYQKRPLETEALQAVQRLTGEKRDIPLLPIEDEYAIYLNVLYVFLWLLENHGRTPEEIRPELNAYSKESEDLSQTLLSTSLSLGWKPLYVLSQDRQDHRDPDTSDLSSLIFPSGTPKNVHIILFAFTLLVSGIVWWKYWPLQESVQISAAGGQLKLIEPWFVQVIGLYWPIALMVSWYLMYAFAKQRNILVYIDLKKKGVVQAKTDETDPEPIIGQHKSFFNDYFFTIHQFIWVPFVFSALYAIHATTGFIDQGIADGFFVDPTTSSQLGEVFESISNLVWHPTLWVAAVALAVYAAHLQWNIQKSRIDSSRDIYWWDWRLDRRIFAIRLLMLVVDWALFVLILWKLIGIVWMCIKIGDENLLRYIVTDPNGMGGLSGFSDVGMAVDTVVVVLGVFIAASVIMHKGLPHYRMTDGLALGTYLIIALLIFFLPAYNIHSYMSDYRDDLISETNNQIELRYARLTSDNVSDNSQIVSEIQAFQDRRKFLSELSTWPFDLNIFSQFFLGILVPFGFVLAQVKIEAFLSKKPAQSTL